MLPVMVINALGHLIQLAPGGKDHVFLWKAFYLKEMSTVSGFKTLHLCSVVDFIGELTWLSSYAQIGHIAPDRKNTYSGLVVQA